MSCKKAVVAAEEMKKIFGEKLNLKIYTTDSEEARKYDFRSSANVLFQGDLIPLDIALDKQKMKNFLLENLS